MNASPRLLQTVNQATVSVRASVLPGHPSTAVLGAERMGSGVVLARGGVILTAQYVLLGASEVTIGTESGEDVAGLVVAQDFATGIAVVEPASSIGAGLEVCPIEEMERGADIFVLGVSQDRSRQVSDGLISSLDRFEANWEFALDPAIATTARNPGLGGAPLVDASGRLLGVTFLDLGEVSRFTLAIPADNYVKFSREFLENGRRVSRPLCAWVGLFCFALREHVIIAGVLPGGPAAAAGLAAGDVVVSLAGSEVETRRSLYEILWAHTPGSSLPFRVYRNGTVHDLVVEATDADDFFAASRNG